MSLPLTRRIAQAALLVGAVAAPLLGATAASAAELSQTPDLSGLTNVDGVSNTVDGASQKTTGVAGDTGSKTVKTAGKTAGKAVGTVGKTAGPAAQKAAGQATATGTTGQALGDTVKSVGGGLPAADALPVAPLAGGGLPAAGNLTHQLPTGQLPPLGG